MIEVPTEQEAAIERLLDKLDKWILQQPEWLYLMSEDRQTRKEVARLVAKELLSIPIRRPSEVPNRAMRRAILAAIRRNA